MFCSSCGKQIPDDSAFCPDCGAKVPGMQTASTAQPRSTAGAGAAPRAGQMGAEAAPAQVRSDLAEFGERFAAGFIDVLVLLIPNLILIGVTQMAFMGTLLSIGYLTYMFSDQMEGQTVGYKVMKLRLIDQETGNPVPAGRTALLAVIFSLLSIISWIWFFTDPNRRMLHNIASKTLVISLKHQP
jgi:uncharacterized RDD family membrane protein YckC